MRDFGATCPLILKSPRYPRVDINMTTCGIQINIFEPELHTSANSNTHPLTWSTVHKEGPATRNVYVSRVLEDWDGAAISWIINSKEVCGVYSVISSLLKSRKTNVINTHGARSQKSFYPVIFVLPPLEKIWQHSLHNSSE